MRVPVMAVLALVLASPARALGPDHRLEHTVRPTGESLTLDVDPAATSYAGTAVIALRVASATPSFQFHARGMQLDRVTLRAKGGVVPATVTVDSNDVATLQAARALAPGDAELTIGFHRDFDRQANGLYRLEANGDWYAYTDFEPNDARQAWPCFDEPEFKIRWQMTVTAPKGLMVVSNSPVASDAVTGTRHRVTFELTPPLPSYLVALAVGPFDAVPIKGMSIPGRVITVRGSGALAHTAARITPPLVAALERYFGRPYPYRKLDLIAVPEFWAGAMENAGAITYRADRLLLDPNEAAPDARRSMVSTTAHELAHMWFGDLVTLAWWDDVWLNESFASWLGDKVSEEAFPAYRYDVRQAADVERAFGLDVSPFARAVRQPVDAFSGFGNLFDPLSYQKGQAVLEMIEAWIGPATFQRGVRAYITAHQWRNATGSDLWNALSQAAGKDVAGPVRSFIEQPGVPLVQATVLPDGGLRLAQSRLVNDPDAPPSGERWQIPVTLRWADGSGVHRRNVLLADTAQVVSLGAPARWVLPDGDARGYYRWAVPPEMLSALTTSSASLSPRERVNTVRNLGALLAAGRLHGDSFLDEVARFADDRDPIVLQSAIDALQPVQRSLVDASNRAGYAAWVRRTFGPDLDRLGMVPAANEDPSTSAVRAALLRVLGIWGRDPAVLERARTLADAWLEDSSAVSPSIAPAALEVSASRGDQARLQLYQDRFARATVPAARTWLLDGIAAFRDTARVSQALAWSLSGPLRPQERQVVLRGATEHPETQDLAFRFVVSHYDEIARFVPPSQRRMLMFVAGGCSNERLAEGSEFFGAPGRRGPTFEREWSRLEGAVKDCVRLHDLEAARVEHYLEQSAASR